MREVKNSILMLVFYLACGAIGFVGADLIQKRMAEEVINQIQRQNDEQKKKWERQLEECGT